MYLMYSMLSMMFSLMGLMLRLMFSPLFLVVAAIVIISLLCAGVSALKTICKFIVIMAIIICIFHACDKDTSMAAMIMGPAFKIF